MARRHGRKGKLYVAATDVAQASPVFFLNAWTMNSATDKVEVSSFDDTNKTYVAGLPDASGTFAGFWDDASDQTFTASRDGLARKFYLYPSLDTPGKYYFGTATFDWSASGGTGEAVTISGAWAASSNIQQQVSP